MRKQNRRNFLKQTGLGIAAVTVLKVDAAQAAFGKSKDIPPHKPLLVPAVHGYAEQSVAAGEKIKFHISNTVPCRLSVYRLGLDPDSMEGDELIHAFGESAPAPQPIHPGSYVHVEKNVKGTLTALTLECWVRPWKLKNWAGVITQHDSAGNCEFGLFLGPNDRIAFCLGNEMQFTDAASQLPGKAGLTANQWHHIVATWDGEHRALYVNGKPVGKWPFADRPSFGKLPLRLGASGEGGEASYFLDGDLAMPAIYQRALKPEEIAIRFEQRALVAPNGRNLLACWPLTEEKGERLADVSGNRRHGAIINHGTWMIGGPSFVEEVPRFGDYDPKKDPQRGHGLRLASDDLYDCRWKPVLEFQIPKDARSGYYVGRIEYDWEGTPHRYHITFIVKKAARKRKAPILLLAATNTWRAYNGAAFPKPDARLKRNMSTQGTANSPGDPPAFCFYRRHAAGQGTYQLGLKMPFASADPYLLYGTEYSHLARADRFMQVWLEKAGYDYDLITDLDLHRDPEILLGYKAFVIAGHSEYWSLPAYHGLENYLKRGGNLAVFSGNSFLWRVSFNDDQSVIECRKVDAPGFQMKPQERGEAYHSHDFKRGGMLRECGYPAYRLIGLDMLGWTGEANFGPYVVDAPDHFLFHHPEETGLKAGDEFGMAPDGQLPRANGHEMDIRMSTFAALQGEATPPGAAMPVDPPGIKRIANGVVYWKKGGSAFDYFFRPIKPETSQGGEMILWEREDGGKVFNAATIASGWTLNADPKFQTLVRNVLFHFNVTPAR